MTRLPERAAGLALAASAMLWPLQVYQYVPGIDLHATQLLAGLLIAALAADALRGRPLRVPFEFAWPAIAAAACVWWSRGADAGLHATGIAIAFLSAVHWTRDHDQAWRLLRLSAWSAVCIALLTVLTEASPGGWPIPTAYRLHPGGGTLAAAFSVPLGVWTLAFGALVLAGDTLRAENPRGFAARLTGAAVAGAVLLWKLPLLGPELPPATPHAVPVLAPAVVLGTWLVARVAAKAAVLELDTGDQRCSALVALAALSGFLFAVTPLDLSLGQAFVLAMAAGAVRRPVREAPPKRGWALALPVALLLVVVNAGSVYPANGSDPRNYAAAAARDLNRGAFDRLRARMEQFDRLHPNERATHRWLAEAAWLQGHERHAMDQLTAAVAPLPTGGRTLLPPPDDAALDPLLQEMRDRVSAEPPAHLAWERLLAGQGKPDSALQFLALRWVQQSDVPAGLPRDALAAAVATLLDAPEMTESLGRLSSERLYAVLQMTGARVEAAPAGVPPDALPVVATVTTRADGVRVSVWSPTGETRLSLAARVEPEAAGEIFWRRAAGEEGRATWRCLGGSGEDLLAELMLTPGGAEMLAPAETGAVLPDATAVLLLTAPGTSATGN